MTAAVDPDRESEAHFRAFFEQSAVGMVLADLRGVWRRVNGKFAGMLGYAPEELAGADGRDHTHPDDRGEDLSLIRRLLEGETSTLIREKRFLHRDGRTVWVEVGASLERGPEGEPRWFIAICQEIGARKAAEQALQEKEAFLDSIYRGVDEAIFVVDAAGDGRFLFAGCNPAYERLAAGHGVATSEFLGNEIEWLARHAPREAVDAVRANYRRCAESGQPLEYEESVRLEGRMTHWSTRLTPLVDAQGRVYRIVGTSRDVSPAREGLERIRKAEEQLRQAQKMEAMGRLAGGIAHDFNNLLTAINGFGDLLLAGMPSEDPHYEGLREIRKAGERATALTRQLLAFGRKQVLNPKDLDLDAVVADIEKLLRRLIGDDVALETRLHQGLPPVLADRGQIEQVIMNLALNARDAMPGGGRLLLETGLAEFPPDAIGATGAPLPPGPAVLLTVTDTGRGMDDATRLRIFEPFFTTKAPGEGTGLGLATVYGIVAQTGGHIQVSSDPGLGTGFRVYLPLAPAAPRTGRPAAAEPKPAPAGSETVLVAEDEDALRRLIERILSGKGYRVLSAPNGLEALRLSESHAGPVHLLLTDVVMPKMGGRELAEALEKARPGLRLAFMSGYTDDTVLRHGILESKAEFLQKPFTPAGLLETVRRVLDAPASRK
jgi:PAS domain S-box-containing protein